MEGNRKQFYGLRLAAVISAIIVPSLVGLNLSGTGGSAVRWLTFTLSLIAALSMLLAGAHSDRTGERRWHLAGAFWVGALGLAASAWVQSPVLTLAAFSVTSLGIVSSLGPFWALGTSVMSSAAAAGAIAYVNSVGNLGGFIGPNLMSSLKGATGNYSLGLYTLAGVLLTGGALALLVRHNPALDRAAAAAGAKAGVVPGGAGSG